MIAGIFHNHGCWAGNCIPADHRNKKGYFENKDVKDWLIRNHGRLAQTTHMAYPGEGFKGYMQTLLGNWKDPWMVKHSAMYFRVWHEFRPKFICIRRSTKGIISSNMECGFMGTKNRDEMLQIIDAHHAAMDLSGGVNVYTDAVVAGDYESLVMALEFAGLEADEQTIMGFIEPGYWRH